MFNFKSRRFLCKPRKHKQFKPDFFILEDRTHPGEILGLSSLAILGDNASLLDQFGLIVSNSSPYVNNFRIFNEDEIILESLDFSLNNGSFLNELKNDGNDAQALSGNVISTWMSDTDIAETHRLLVLTLDLDGNMELMPLDSSSKQVSHVSTGISSFSQDESFDNGLGNSSFITGSGNFSNEYFGDNGQEGNSGFGLIGGGPGFNGGLDPGGFTPNGDSGWDSNFSSNQPPFANDDAFSTNWGQTLISPTGALLINDGDPDNDPITAILVHPPVSGQLSEFNANGSFTYVPTPGFVGVDKFTYKVTDGSLDSNEATVSISVASDNVVTTLAVGEVLESGTHGSFTINRTGTLTYPLLVKYNFAGAALHGFDYYSRSGEAYFASGISSVSVDIEPLNDDYAESTEAITLQIEDTDYYDPGSPSSSTLNLIDDTNDSGSIITGSVSTHLVENSATSGEITLLRTGSTAAALSISYTIGGSAKPGIDYGTLSGTATFAIGSNNVSIPVNALDDSWSEGNETVSITLQQPKHSSVYVESVEPISLSIADDASDTNPVLSVTPIGNLQENGGLQNAFTIHRTGSVMNFTLVEYQLNYKVDGTLVASDQVMMFFMPGISSSTIQVTPTDDSLAADSTKTVELQLLPGSYDISAIAPKVEVGIEEDDTLLEVHFDQASASYWHTGIMARICRKGKKTSDLEVNFTLSGPTNLIRNPTQGKVKIPKGSGCVYIPIEPKDGPGDPVPPPETPPIVITIDPIPDVSIPDPDAEIHLPPFFPNPNPGPNPPNTGGGETPVVVDVYATDNRATEGATPTDGGQFRFVRSGQVGQALTVRFIVSPPGYTTDPLADPQADISPTLTVYPAYNTITFPAQSSYAYFDYTAVDDLLYESAEQLVFEVISGPGYEPGSHPVDHGTIIDNETSDYSANFQVIDGEISTGVGLLKEGNITLTESLMVGNNVTADSDSVPDASLIFNSRERDSIPVIQAKVQLNPNSPRPLYFKMQITWDGQSLPERTINFPQESTINWHSVPITLAAPAAKVTTTGIYNYSVILTAVYGNQANVVQNWSSSALVASKYHSNFGSGWSMGALDQLVVLSNDDIVRQYGTGGWGLYKKQTDGSYLSPWGDYGKLEKLTNGLGQTTGYKHTLPSREVRLFTPEGYQTQWISSDTLKSFIAEYDPQTPEELKKITWLDGSTITCNYSAWNTEGHRRIVNIVTKFPDVSPSQPGAIRTYGFNYDQGDFVLQHTRYLRRISRPDGGQRYIQGDDLVLKDKIGTLETIYTEEPLIPGVVTDIKWGGTGTVSTYGVQSTVIAGLHETYPGPVKAVYTLPNITGQLSPEQFVFTLDSVGRVMTRTAPDGGIWNYNRDSNGEVVAASDPLNRVTQYQYDTFGYVTKVTYPDSTREEFFYKSVPANVSANQQRRVIDYTLDERGLRTDFVYSADTYGHLTRIVLPHDPGISYTPYLTPTWDFVWTGGEISKILDPRKSSTTFTRDVAGRVTSVKDHLNNVTTLTLNPFDDYTAITDPLNRTINVTYNGMHRPLTVQYPDPAPSNPSINGPLVTTQYDLFGSGLIHYTTIDSKNLSMPLRITNAFDNRGLLTSVIEASEYPTITALPSRNTQYSYNNRGQFVATTDPSNPGTRRYDAVGRLDRITYRDVTPTEIVNFTYNLAGEVTDTYDELNRRTQYEYYPRGWLKKTTQHGQANDLVMTYGYDPSGNPTDVTDGQNHTWSARYDELGRVYETYDPLGNRTSLFYDGASNLISVRDAEDHQTQLTYDALNRLVEQTDAPGTALARRFYTAYDAVGQVSYTLDPDLHKTSFEYDNLGRLTRLTEADDLPAYRRATTIDYSGYFVGSNSGSIVTVTDPLNRQSQSKDDLLGRPFVTTAPDPDGPGGNPAPSMQFTYNAGDQLTKITDHLGRATDYTYYRNAVTTVTHPDPDGAGALPRPKEYVSYTPAMEVLETGITDLSTSSNHFRTRFTYNDLGQLTQATEGYGTSLARSTGYQYDALGRLEVVTDPRNIPTSYQYDAAYRLTGVTMPDPDGAGSQTSSTITYQYNKINQISSVTLPDPDAGGPLGSLVTQYEYDDLARTKKITDPRNSVTQFTYHWHDQIKTLSDPLSNVTTWNYDPLGRVTSETNALNAARTYQWDAGDRLTSMTDRRGWVTEFSYDDLDRVTEEFWHQGNAQSPVVNGVYTSYNEAGLVSSISDNQATLSYGYDGLDRLLSETSSYVGSGVLALSTLYAFNSKGQRVTTAFKVGSTTDRTEEYGYDDLGRMTWQKRTGTGAALRVEQDYDAADRMIEQRRFANSAGTGTPAVTTIYGYDDRNRQTNVTHRQGTGSGTILQQFDYMFNPVDWLTSEAKTIGGTTNTDAYTYDAGGQIITATHTDRATENFTWDANGNPTGTGYFISTNNQLMEDPDYIYTYDAEGNRATRTAKVGGAVNNYSWDNRNRLASSTVPAGTVSQKYDALDRRVGTSAGGTSSWFAYDGDHVMSVHQGSMITDRFTLGAGIDESLSQEKNGTLRWLLTDGRGSVTGTTISNGSSTGNRNFGTFGSTQSQSGTTDSFFAYTGREWDEAAGLQYSRNRWYDPSSKRWLSEDPIGFNGGDSNLSRYVRNSPGTFIDPSGLKLGGWNGESGNAGIGYQSDDRGQEYRNPDDESGPDEEQFALIWSAIIRLRNDNNRSMGGDLALASLLQMVKDYEAVKAPQNKPGFFDRAWKRTKCILGGTLSGATAGTASGAAVGAGIGAFAGVAGPGAAAGGLAGGIWGGIDGFIKGMFAEDEGEASVNGLKGGAISGAGGAAGKVLGKVIEGAVGAGKTFEVGRGGLTLASAEGSTFATGQLITITPGMASGMAQGLTLTGGIGGFGFGCYLFMSSATPAKSLSGRPHGGSAHDAAIDAQIGRLKGARDIRKNQAQVDANGKKVSDYRPDAQWTDKNGVRHYHEVSSKTSKADPARLRKYDSNAVIEVHNLDTGQTVTYRPGDPIP